MQPEFQRDLIKSIRGRIRGHAVSAFVFYSWYLHYAGVFSGIKIHAHSDSFLLNLGAISASIPDICTDPIRSPLVPRYLCDTARSLFDYLVAV